MTKLLDSPRIIIHDFAKHFSLTNPPAGSIEIHWLGESAMIKYKELNQALEGLTVIRQIITDQMLPLRAFMTSNLIANHIIQIKYHESETGN